jgi:CrcB protein
VSVPLPARPPLRLVAVLVVAVGGALGALLRVAVGLAWPVDGFGWSTLLVNLSGSAALAALPALAVVRRHPLAAPFLGTGVLGGYTTLSTASAETLALLEDGRVLTALAYAGASLAACLVAVALVDHLTTPDERAAFDRDEGDL